MDLIESLNLTLLRRIGFDWDMERLSKGMSVLFSFIQLGVLSFPLYCMWMSWRINNCQISGRVQGNLKTIAFSQGPATSESNILPVPRASPDSAALRKARSLSGSKDYQLAGQMLITRYASGRSTPKTKVDMELLAQNRGNAVLRYKEKKKTRRYDQLNYPLSSVFGMECLICRMRG